MIAIKKREDVGILPYVLLVQNRLVTVGAIHELPENIHGFSE